MDPLLEGVEESRRFRAVHDAVVNGESEGRDAAAVLLINEP